LRTKGESKGREDPHLAGACEEEKASCLRKRREKQRKKKKRQLIGFRKRDI